MKRAKGIAAAYPACIVQLHTVALIVKLKRWKSQSSIHSLHVQYTKYSTNYNLVMLKKIINFREINNSLAYINLQDKPSKEVKWDTYKNTLAKTSTVTKSKNCKLLIRDS